MIILHKPGGAFSSEPHHCLFLQARSDRKMRPQCCFNKVDMFCLIVFAWRKDAVALHLYITRNKFIVNGIEFKYCNMWLYENKEVNKLPEDCVGFVYQITNTTNGRMYIGKKLAKFKRSRPPLKGRRNKRRYKVNSDWEDYYGSSDNLTIDIKRLGKNNFKREILFYCKSKAELSYIEAREQFARKVLESNDYYNGHIRVRIHGSGILREKTTKGILKEKAST